MGTAVAGMSDSPSGMVDTFKRACVGILVGAIAIYLAVGLIKAVWPVLVVIGGIVGAIWLGTVAYKAWHERW